MGMSAIAKNKSVKKDKKRQRGEAVKKRQRTRRLVIHGKSGLGKVKNVGHEVRDVQKISKDGSDRALEMGSHLQLSGQWTACGATAGVKHHLGV